MIEALTEKCFALWQVANRAFSLLNIFFINFCKLSQIAMVFGTYEKKIIGEDSHFSLVWALHIEYPKHVLVLRTGCHTLVSYGPTLSATWILPTMPPGFKPQTPGLQGVRTNHSATGIWVQAQ